MIYHYKLDAKDLSRLNRQIDRFLSDDKLIGNSFDPYLFDHRKNIDLLEEYSTEPLNEALEWIFFELRSMKSESPGAVLITGYDELDDKSIGATPHHWTFKRSSDVLRRFETLQLIFALKIGDAYSSPTTQDGHLVHEMMPMPEYAEEQYGTGSTKLLLHTEDAFLVDCPDFLLLAAVRNQDNVETVVSIPQISNISDSARERLSTSSFFFIPDGSHLLAKTRDDSYCRVVQCRDDPHPLPILYGPSTNFFLRYDEAFMNDVEDTNMLSSYRELQQEVQARAQGIALAMGDILVINNKKSVHGRNRFRPKYDGSDRWVRRLFVKREF